jgi:hypothetical protein
MRQVCRTHCPKPSGWEQSYLLRNSLVFVAFVGLILAAGCNQVTSSNEALHDDRQATVTANVAATLSSSTLNSSLLSESLAVQDAMDQWMAETGDWPPALEEPTDDLRTTDPVLSPIYLSKLALECKYTWDSQGRTSQHC